MKKIFKEDKAITLIALVVTIIVLIILAGVSISMIMGENGIIAKSKQAKREQKVAEIIEELELKKGELAIENESKTLLNSYIEKIQSDTSMKHKVTRSRKNR